MLTQNPYNSMLTVVNAALLPEVWNVTPVMWVCGTTLGTKATLALNPRPSLFNYGWKHFNHVNNSFSFCLSFLFQRHAKISTKTQQLIGPTGPAPGKRPQHKKLQSTISWRQWDSVPLFSGRNEPKGFWLWIKISYHPASVCVCVCVCMAW